MCWKPCISTRATKDFVAHDQRNSLELAELSAFMLLKYILHECKCILKSFKIQGHKNNPPQRTVLKSSFYILFPQ